MPSFPFFRFRSIPALLAALVVLSAGPGARAQAGPDSDLAPQTIGGQAVVEIAAGLGHSCARVVNGSVHCWGANALGQLGNGTTTNSLQPVPVSGLTNVIQISAGQDFYCALRSSGRVFCWGWNGFGQLGDGTTVSRTSPVRVVSLTDVTQVGAGRFHGCAVRSSGRVFCWGRNDSGQLGDGTTTTRPTPVRVEGPGVAGAIQVAGGTSHSCLLRQIGRVTCWGSNQFGQLGDGTTTARPDPTPIPTLTNVTQLDVAHFHSCALRGSGRVFCWGSNFHGQTGNGTRFNNQPTPVRVVNLTSVVGMGLDGQHSCAIRSSGRVFCWGLNTDGQLGDGTTTDRPTPVRVVGPLMVSATQLALSSNHSCGVRANGRGYCWGANGFGQLGDGTTTDSPVPVRIRD